MGFSTINKRENTFEIKKVANFWRKEGFENRKDSAPPLNRNEALKSLNPQTLASFTQKIKKHFSQFFPAKSWDFSQKVTPPLRPVTPPCCTPESNISQ